MESSSRNKFMLPSTFYIFYDDIDAQHEELIGFLNDCMARLENGALEAPFEALFEEFAAKLAAHFRYEEHLMRELGYGGLEGHARHHEECLARMHKMIADIRNQGYAGMRELRVCFHDIIQAVVHADLKFSEFLEGQGLSQREH